MDLMGLNHEQNYEQINGPTMGGMIHLVGVFKEKRLGLKPKLQILQPGFT